jgi:hypothetical protein
VSLRGRIIKDSTRYQDWVIDSDVSESDTDTDEEKEEVESSDTEEEKNVEEDSDGFDANPTCVVMPTETEKKNCDCGKGCRCCITVEPIAKADMVRPSTAEESITEDEEKTFSPNIRERHF